MAVGDAGMEAIAVQEQRLDAHAAGAQDIGGVGVADVQGLVGLHACSFQGGQALLNVCFVLCAVSVYGTDIVLV